MDSPDKVRKYIPVGDMLAGKTFDSFDKIKRRVNKIIIPIRDNWLTSVLIKNNVFVNHTLMTKREIVEIFEKHGISIINEGDIYRVYQNEEVIGEWDNRQKIRITKYGRLQVRVQYIIK